MITCCWTSLDKSQQETFLTLINRPCLCMLPAVKLFIGFTRPKPQAARAQTNALTNNGTPVGRQLNA